jgi:ATP-binding cassette subfamily F protein 3
LDNVTTHTIGINRNGIEKVKGGTKKLFELILQKEEIQERTRINIDKKRSKAESFITRFSAKSSKAKQAQSRQKSLEKLPALEKLLDLYNLKFSFKSALFPGKKILSAEGVNFSYNNEIKSKAEKDLIENFSIIVEKEDRVAIVGKNGYGKSTILKLLASELKPNAGNIYISENAKIGYFGQTNINRLDPSMTVEEEISASNRMISVGESRSICGQMMFSKDEANKKISVLSGGEKSRVLLGKILAKQCNLLLLDEPTNHLDMESIEALLEALESFPGSVIIVTHSELILRRLSLSKVVICSQTEQELFVGNYDEFLEKKGWPEDFTSKKEKKAIGHKELKKIRAEITRDRANELRDIKKFISNIERNIISREKELEEDNKNLINASNESNSLEIVKLSKSISENQTKIESLFDELDQLSKEHEKIKSYYDSKLKSL